MNPIEIEDDIRNLELMLGSSHGRRDHVKAVIRSRELEIPELVVESDHTTISGKMFILSGSHPYNLVPRGYDFQI